MKWKTPLAHTPSPGAMRVRRIFAFYPKKCADGTTRWLEFVYKVEFFERNAKWDLYSDWVHAYYEPLR